MARTRSIRATASAICLATTLLAAAGCGEDSPTEVVDDDILISDDAVVIDSTTLTLVSDSAERSAGTFIFRVIGQSPDITAGDVIVGPERGGFLRRVTAVSRLSGDSVLLQTEDAALADVIMKGGFSWSGPLEFDFSQSQHEGEVGYVHRALSVGKERASGDISFTLDGFGINMGADGDLQVQHGSFRFDPQLDIDGEFDHGLQEFHAIVSGDLDFDILAELALSATDGVRAEIELISDWRAPKPIIIWVEGVPIVIFPEFDLLLGVEVSASRAVSVTGGVETDNSVEAGFRWTNTGGFETVYDENFSGQILPLEASAQVGHELRLYLKPRVSFLVYTVAGPDVALEPYAREGSTLFLPQSEYCTEWSLGIGGKVGAHLEIFDWEFSAGLDLFDRTTVLGEDCVALGGEAVWESDFESYTTGSWPSNWLPDGNGTDNSANYIDATVAYGGQNSLRLFGRVGGCWGALAYREIAVTPPFYVEVAVRNGNENLSGCHPDRADFGLRQCCDWRNPSRPFVRFKGDGTIRSAGGSTLETYTPLVWYRVAVRYERPSPSEVRITYWIDGEYKGYETLTASPDEDSLTHLEIVSQEGTVWFDDVRVLRQ